MNKNKINLILFIAQLSDEQCARILEKFTEKLANKSQVDNLTIYNSKEWDELEHPRHDDGRFAPNGSGREKMTRTEAKSWDKTGRSYPYDKRLTAKKAEISKLKRKLNTNLSIGEKNHLRSDIVQKERELAELTRDIKLERRMKIEGKVLSRILKKKVKKFSDLEEEIDYIEEKYADRNPNSPTQGQVIFPETKSGRKALAKYERLKAERDELDDEIDWELVDKETPEDDDNDE